MSGLDWFLYFAMILWSFMASFWGFLYGGAVLGAFSAMCGCVLGATFGSLAMRRSMLNRTTDGNS